MLVKAGQIIAIDSVKVDPTLSGDGVNSPLGVKAVAPTVSGHAGLSAEKNGNDVFLGLNNNAIKIKSPDGSVEIKGGVQSDGTFEYNIQVSAEPVVSDTKIYGGEGIEVVPEGSATYRVSVSGDYLKPGALNGYATETWVNDKGYATENWTTENFQPKGEYVVPAALDYYYKKTDIDAYSAKVNSEFNETSAWTKSEFQPKSEMSAYYKKSEVDNLLDKYALSADVDTAIAKNEADIKAWANDEFQKKGSYASATEITSLSSTVDIKLADKADKSYVDETFQVKGNYVTSADNELSGKALVLKDNKWEEAPEGTTYTQGPNIDIHGTVISGRDWMPELSAKADKSALEGLATQDDLDDLRDAIAENLVEALDATSAWAKETFQLSGDYLTNKDLEDYYIKSEVDGKVEELSATIDRDFATKTELNKKLDESETTNWDVKEYSAGNGYITIQNHKISGKDWSTEIDAKQDKLTDKQLSAISSVSAIQAISGDWATKTEVNTLVDNKVEELSATVSRDYLKKADVKEYSAGDNIDITNYVISGRDWSSELNTKVNNSNFTVYSATVDNQISEKLDKSEFDTYSADIDSQLVTLSANKLDKSYSATVNSLLDDKLDKTDFNTYSATVDNQIAAKLNTSDFDKYKSAVSAEFSATSAWTLDTFFKTSEYFYAVSGINSSSEYFKWTGDTLSASWMVKHFNLSFNYAVKPVSASPDFIYGSHMIVGNTPIDDKHYVEGYSDTVNYNVSFNIYNADNKTYKFTFSADNKLNLENLYISCIGFINPSSLSGNFGFVEDGTSGNFVDSQGNNLIFVEKLPVG